MGFRCCSGPAPELSYPAHPRTELHELVPTDDATLGQPMAFERAPQEDASPAPATNAAGRPRFEIGSALGGSVSVRSDMYAAWFIVRGYHHLEGAFDRSIADACVSVLWRLMGVRPDAPSTWTQAPLKSSESTTTLATGVCRRFAAFARPG